MRKIQACFSVLFCFIAFALFGEDYQDISQAEVNLSSECEPMTTVAGCVNVSSGNFFQVEQDILVNAVDSLHITRFYESEQGFISWMGFGFASNYNLMATSPQKHRKHYYAIIQERKGFPVTYQSEEESQGYKADPRLFEKGYTNVAKGGLNLARARAEFKPEESWTLHLSDGSKRCYQERLRSKKKYNQEWYTKSQYALSEEILPSGNKIKVEHAFGEDGKLHPTKLTLFNRDKTKVMGELSFVYNGHDSAVASNQKQTVFYKKVLEKHKGKARNGHRHEIEAEFLKEIVPSTGPATTYSYECKESQDNLRLARISRPEGRFLEVEYDDKKRVKKLSAPVGPLNKNVPIYRFDYEKKETKVQDALGQTQVYKFNDDKRLASIDYLDHQGHVLKREHFYWHDNGQIKAKGVSEGSTRKGVYYIAYEYDDLGNCIKETLYGNLTGTRQETFDFDHLDEADHYSTTYKYSNDDFNLVVEKIQNGVRTSYSYVPNTNLLASEIVEYQGEVQERTFHFYDDCGICIHTIKDDGCGKHWNDLSKVDTRLISYMIPDTRDNSPSFGKPLQIVENYYCPKQYMEIRLKHRDFAYNDKGLLIEERVFDAKGQPCYTLHFAYDSKNRLIAKTDALGHATYFNYDENNNLIFESVQGSGLSTHCFYDLGNRLIRKEERHQDSVFVYHYQYDALSQLISEIDEMGRKTEYQYDRLGRQIQIIKPTMEFGCPKVNRRYNILNQVIEETNENGFTTKTAYNVYGQPTRIIYPDKSEEWRTYYPNGRLRQKCTPDGTLVEYTYNPRGLLICEQTKNLHGAVIKEIHYAYKGRLLVGKTDAKGLLTKYFYNGAGQKNRETFLDKETLFTYDTLGRLQTINRQGEQMEVLAYDDLDRLTSRQKQDAIGNVYEFETYIYDIQGNQTHRIEAQNVNESALFETKYRSDGRVEYEKDPLGNLTCYQYDDHHINCLGRVTKKETLESSGCLTIEVFDTYEHPIRREIYFAGILVARTLYHYDLMGQLIEQKESVIEEGQIQGEFTIQWKYNHRGLVTELIEPGKVTSYQYDVLGRLIGKIKPDGTVVAYAYDSLNRMVAMSTKDIAYQYIYDENDNLIEVHDLIHKSVQTRMYDSYNRLIKEEFKPGLALYYRYDLLDRLTRLTLPDGAYVDYHYENNPYYLGAIVRKDPAKQESYRCHYHYDLAGRLVQQITPAGAITTKYDLLSRPVMIESKHWKQTIEYDPLTGNLIRYERQDPDGKEEKLFSYDPLDQLTEEPGHQYVFDSLNNRKKQDGLACKVLNNQLISDGKVSYTYDRNGNLQTEDDIRYSYDALDRLQDFAQSNEKTSYQYDGLGRCLEMETPSGIVSYLYQDQVDVGSWNGQIHEFRIVDPQNPMRTLVIELDGKAYIPVQDQCGSICCLLDLDGNPKEWYDFGVFGNEKKGEDSLNPWRFAGKRKIGHLIYFGKRFYHPSLGRWLTPDPAGFEDGPNLYAYVHNNPLTHFDLLGLSDLNCQHLSWWQRWLALDDFCSDDRKYSDIYTNGALATGMAHGSLKALFDLGSTFGLTNPIEFSCPDCYSHLEGLYDVGSIVGEAGTHLAVESALMTAGWGIAKNTFNISTKLSYVAKANSRIIQSSKFNEKLLKLSQKVDAIRNEVSLGSTAMKESLPCLDKLSKAGQVMDRGGLTKAGRALDKHGARLGSVFPKATGNVASKSMKGQFCLDNILTHPESVVHIRTHKHFGKIIDIKVPNVGGARFTLDGQLLGFLEP